MKVSRRFYFLNKKKGENKSFGIGKLATASPYIPTFTSLLNPSKKTILNALKKTSKGKKVAYSLFLHFCAFCVLFVFFVFFCVYFDVLKKHLRRRKSLVWRFVFFVLFVLFMLFMPVKSIWVKVACLRFVLFVCVKSFRLKNKTALIPSVRKRWSTLKISSSWRT